MILAGDLSGFGLCVCVFDCLCVWLAVICQCRRLFVTDLSAAIISIRHAGRR